MQEANAGYTIKERISLQDSVFVLGHNPNAPAPWVTWEHVILKEMSSSYYHHGNYFTDEVSARLNILQRAIECLPQEQVDQLALSILSDEARADLSSKEREEDAWANIESCFYDAAEFLSIPDIVATRLLNDPQFRSEALRVFWNQDHSYENEALQESLELLIRDRFSDKLYLSHEDAYTEIANRLEFELQSGEAATFIDVCAELPLNQKKHLLVVWGEENDVDDKFFSVSIYTTDRNGHQAEQLVSAFSDSESFEDLKKTVFEVLDQFEANMARETKQETSTPFHQSLSDQISSAEKRQGRGEVPQTLTHTPSQPDR